MPLRNSSLREGGTQTNPAKTAGFASLACVLTSAYPPPLRSSCSAVASRGLARGFAARSAVDRFTQAMHCTRRHAPFLMGVGRAKTPDGLTRPKPTRGFSKRNVGYANSYFMFRRTQKAGPLPASRMLFAFLSCGPRQGQGSALTILMSAGRNRRNLTPRHLPAIRCPPRLRGGVFGSHSAERALLGPAARTGTALHLTIPLGLSDSHGKAWGSQTSPGATSVHRIGVVSA